MIRSQLRAGRFVVLLFVLVAAISLSTWAEYCVDCSGGASGFWCVGAANGAQRCRANETICFLHEACPSSPPVPPPPPPPPPPGPGPKDIAQVGEYYFELPSYANLNQVPTTLSNPTAWDVESLKDEIAGLAGVLTKDIFLKGAIFGVGSIPFDGKSGVLVDDTAFSYALDRLSVSEIRARTCSSENGGEQTLASDNTVSSNGAVVLVPITIKGSPGIAAYQIIITNEDDYDPYGQQAIFRNDTEDHLDEEPWWMAGAEMAACE